MQAMCQRMKHRYFSDLGFCLLIERNKVLNIPTYLCEIITFFLLPSDFGTLSHRHIRFCASFGVGNDQFSDERSCQDRFFQAYALVKAVKKTDISH